MTELKNIGLGLLGLGTVGSAVVELLKTHEDSLRRRLGANLVLKKICVRQIDKPRPNFQLSRDLLTDKIEQVVRHPEVDIVIEVMGGIDQARFAILEALENNKQVVSANKALIATHGVEIFDLAQKKERDFLFEAAVAGGIPILRVLREAYVGNRITELMGIVNGTCNFILTEMAKAAAAGKALEFKEVLQEAQNKGYAEADPTIDVDATDSTQKLAILASLAFGSWIDYRKIYKEGITELKAVDFEMAKDFGFRIKLLGIAKEHDEGLELRVHPTLLSEDKLLAPVDDVYNAIFLRGDFVGPSLLSGRGAGGGPTASAVVSDVIDLGRNLLMDSATRVPVLSYPATHLRKTKLLELKNLLGRYYLRMTVVDRPGVLASIAQVLGEFHVSIATLVQRDKGRSAPVAIVMLTHETKESDIKKAIAKIDNLEVVVDKTLAIRIEE